MLCDRCNINQASIHLENNINGVVRKAELCPQCAKLMGLSADSGLFEKFLGQSILAAGGVSPEFLGLSKSPSTEVRAADSCPDCGTSFQTFQKTALFGCPSCYAAFAPRLASIFKRVQAGPSHVGRKLGRVAELPSELQAATKTPASEGLAAPTATKKRRATVRKKAAPSSADGAANVGASDLHQLQQAQREAVLKEDYEAAAQIRDRIKALQLEAEKQAAPVRQVKSQAKRSRKQSTPKTKGKEAT